MAAQRGMIQLYAGSNPMVDIVAVHGLNGDPRKTWTAQGRPLPWLQEFLPKVVPNSRILTWGYNANVMEFLGPTSSDGVLQHAQTLISQLHTDRSVGMGSSNLLRSAS